MSEENIPKPREPAEEPADTQLPAIALADASTGTSAVAATNEEVASPRSSSDESDDIDLKSFFECPVCFDYVLPPIMQCSSGHLICESCISKLPHCPLCRGPLPNIRNLAMENIAAKVKFPCKYGCTAKLAASQKLNHETTCKCRVFTCPRPGSPCEWHGTLDQIIHHLKTHENMSTLEGKFILFSAVNIYQPGTALWIMLQSCFRQHFMVVLKKQEICTGYQKFFGVIQLIGAREQADLFTYRMELRKNTNRLSWESKPCSIYDGFESAIKKADCLSFEQSAAQLFSVNESLCIDISISLA